MAKVEQNRIPAFEAGSAGPADQNETTPATQRSPGGKHLPQTEGPVRHEKTTAFLPAEYPIRREVMSAKGEPVVIESRRRDR